MPRVTPRKRAPQLRIGCSGWTYAGWRREFYPPSLATGASLAHYTSVFDTVETNGTFYRLPAAETFVRWKAVTPDDFLMSVKASRYLTHLKQLKILRSRWTA
ncbi:MAG: DUF72 domain-containing protein [Vicinamibacterales bacterium]